MSAVNKIFSKVPVDIPNRSGFDCSHENLFTAKCGTLVPILCNELLPNDKVTLGISSQIQLPPMASDFYGRVRGKFEAFFVPNRILYRGWQRFITKRDMDVDYMSNVYIPGVQLTASSSFNTKFSAGTLADYLGFKVRKPAGGFQTGDKYTIDNVLPFLAYQKIYDDWYRDSRITSSLFADDEPSDMGLMAAYMPNVAITSSSDRFISDTLADGSSLFDLRQRCFARDYFTNATTSPQVGTGSSLSFDVDVQGEEGSFSIASLRAANSLQKWLERNNLAGQRYSDQIRAQFGCYPADAVTDRAIYLGSQSVDVYNKSVYLDHPDQDVTQDRNPFNNTGAKFSSPLAVGTGSLVDSFTATEHGFLFVFFSLVPDILYGTGCHKMFGRKSIADFAFPLLAGVGDQEINDFELVGQYPNTPNNVFGYTQRFSEYKFCLDEVHGLLRSGESLEHFALDSSFPLGAYLSTEFVEIPTDYLDDVTAMADAMSDYGCWADVFFNYKKSSVLPAYSIPTLGDERDTHVEIIPNGGTRL